jgi:hypothetical protein
MGIQDFTQEISIRRTLRALAKQRVAMILKPGNVLVIEKAIVKDEDTEANLRTCQLRGWIEILENAIPSGKLTEDGRLPVGNPFTNVEPLFRLTDSGWNVIHGNHVWIVTTCLVAWATLVATLIGVLTSSNIQNLFKNISNLLIKK